MAEDVAETNGIETNERGELVLDIDVLRPKPRWLRVSGNLIKIPGMISLEDMLDLRAMEQTLRNPKGTEDEAIDALQRFTAKFSEITSRENPDLDNIRLDLDVITATRLLSFLAQPDDSVAMAFVSAITAGGGDKPDAASKDAHALARAAGLEPPEAEAEAGRPLRSGKRSSSRSSGSGSSTTGRRSGGSGRAARGKRSASTSRTRSNGKKSASAN